MPAMDVRLNGDDAAFGRDVGVGRLPILHTLADWRINAVRSGMQSGRTSLIVAIPVEDGLEEPAVVLAETSLNAWMMASNALAAAFREEIERPGWAALSSAARAMIVPRYAEAIRRAIPTATREQATLAANMMLDSLGSGDGS